MFHGAFVWFFEKRVGTKASKYLLDVFLFHIRCPGIVNDSFDALEIHSGQRTVLSGNGVRSHKSERNRPA